MEKLEITKDVKKKQYKITKVYRGGCKTQVKTPCLSHAEFEELEHNTKQDWIDYMRNNELIKIK
jgi:hypothetical protein